MMITNTTKKVCLAVDTSYEQGGLVLLSSGSIIFSQVFDEKLSHGKALCEALQRAKQSAQAHNLELGRVFCGLGPGSFVGIRIALATMLGYCFARSLPLMGFCSHVALAYSIEPRRESFYIFMKASGHLGYLSYFELDGDRLKRSFTKVTNIDELASVIKNNTSIFSNQVHEITNVLPNDVEVISIAGPSPEGIAKASLHRLHEAGSFVDESDFIKPNYIKPPNVSMPKIL